MFKRKRDPALIVGEAWYWSELIRKGPMTPQSKEQLTRWLADDDHRAYFLKIEHFREPPDADALTFINFDTSTTAKPPGHAFTSFALRTVSAESARRYLQPAIADMHHEYFQARQAGRPWRARLILVRGAVLVIPGWIYAFVTGTVKRIFSA